MSSETMSPQELQQEVQRFATQLMDLCAQAAEPLERSLREKVRTAALRNILRSVAAMMEIATGPTAIVNFLDMTVFLRVSRSTLERYWIPTLYGEAGLPLLKVFTRAEEELSTLSSQVISSDERSRLNDTIEGWLERNPHQVRVEGIRLADFSSVAASGSPSAGLLSSIKTMKQAAHQAVQLSERGLFLVHRLPFLWRLQARLGAREVVSDTVRSLWKISAAIGVLMTGLFLLHRARP